MAPLPIKFQELVQLSSLGVDTQSIGFNSCVSGFRKLYNNISLANLYARLENNRH